MTHIEQMIQDMCPNGVEWKQLGEVCTIETGKLNANAAVEGGQYPFFTTSKEISYINDYKWDTEALLIAGNANIGDVKHYIGKFNAYQRTYVLTSFEESLIVRFLYHYTKARLRDFLDDKKNEAAMSYIVLSSLQAFPVPIPPLDIQKKIVECLDKFSALAAELQAELQARRKQYEFYRTQLLTPPQNISSVNSADERNWEWKTLEEICDLVKERVSAAELNENNYVGVENMLSNKQGKIPSVSVPATGNVIKFSKDNILIGNIRPYLRKIWFADCDGGTNGDVITLEIKDKYQNMILPKFLYHALADERFFIYDTQYSSGAKMPRGDKDKVMEYKIPLPALEEQARIVSILDKFEALTTSLSDGIPAEQAAQQKRYEYYRDKLLSFEKKGN